MNAFIPEHPVVVIQLTEDGGVRNIATNISSDLTVVVVQGDDSNFRIEAANKPFRSDALPQPYQVMAHDRH